MRQGNAEGEQVSRNLAAVHALGEHQYHAGHRGENGQPGAQRYALGEEQPAENSDKKGRDCRQRRDVGHGGARQRQDVAKEHGRKHQPGYKAADADGANPADCRRPVACAEDRRDEQAHEK